VVRDVLTMNRNSQQWKRWIRAGLAVLLILDVVLIILGWRVAQSGSQAQKDEARRLAQQAQLLEKDVARAETIQRHMPEVRHNCDHFYEEQFLPASSGYSSVEMDLGQIAAHSGLKTTGLSFKQSALEKRGVVEVQINAAVEGDYPSLIHFINGLERSENFYLLNNLTLASVSTGSIKLNLELRTYFRS
jgi:Tfp pilus assembly protein PilO